MKKTSLFALAASLLLCSCDTSSLSGGSYGSGVAAAGGYAISTASLTDADAPSEASIREALKRNQGRAPVRIPRGSRVLLIQDDAALPDQSLVEAFAPYCEVVPYSGKSANSSYGEDKPSSEAVQRKIRYDAAQAGARYVILITGVFESTKEDLATKTVSWVPIVGQVIPDETRLTRMKLAAVTIDTASGRWNSVSGPSTEPKRNWSNKLNRGSSRDVMLAKMREASWDGVAQQIFR